MVKPAMIVGGVVSLGCLAFAPLDGGLSSFASWSSFTAALGAGTVSSAEVTAACVAGTAVSKLVEGLISNDKEKYEKQMTKKENLQTILNDTGKYEKQMTKKENSQTIFVAIFVFWICSLLIARFMGLRVLVVSFAVGFGWHKMLAYF